MLYCFIKAVVQFNIITINSNESNTLNHVIKSLIPK